MDGSMDVLMLACKSPPWPCQSAVPPRQQEVCMLLRPNSQYARKRSTRAASRGYQIPGRCAAMWVYVCFQNSLLVCFN